MNNPYYMTQPYQNPYSYSAMSNTLIRVTGIEGAKAYQMAANSVVPLFDSSEDIMYIKSTDGAGFPTIRAFEFREISQKGTQKPTEDFISRSEFEEFKKEMTAYAQQFISKPANNPKSKPHDEF